MAEAYLYDDFDVEGEIEQIFGLADTMAAATAGWRKKLRAAKDLLRLPAIAHEQANGRGAARRGARRGG